MNTNILVIGIYFIGNCADAHALLFAWKLNLLIQNSVVYECLSKLLLAYNPKPT